MSERGVMEVEVEREGKRKRRRKERVRREFIMVWFGLEDDGVELDRWNGWR